MYNTSLFEDLCRTVDRPRTTGGVRPRQKTPQEIRLLQRRKQYLEKQKEQKEEDKRLIKRHLQNKKKKEDAKFRQMFAKLDKGRELVKSVDEFVELTDSKEKIKKKKIYREWRDGVFNKVQSSVAQHIENTDHKALHRLRRERYQKFLDDTNTSSGVFLDSHPPPRIGNKINVGRLHDPTLRIVQRSVEEAKMLKVGPSSGKTTKSVSPGRMDVRRWAAGKVEDESAGYCERRFAGAEPRAPCEMEKKVRIRTNAAQDHYTYPKNGITGPFMLGRRKFKEKSNASSRVNRVITGGF